MLFQSLFLLSAIFVGSHGASVRIVNGVDAKEGEFPFAVPLLRNNALTCGATILNSKFVLTAAHCACSGSEKAMDSKQFSIQYGVTTRGGTKNVIKVAKITCNRFQRAPKIIFDVAVIELAQALPNDGSWKTVTLAKTVRTSEEQSGVVIGWGRLKANGNLPNNLQKLNVTVYGDAVCKLRNDIAHHVCFGTPIGGACNGDSGTALLVNGQQVGVASYITSTCGISNRITPNVYARVDAYYDWIKSIAGEVSFA